MQLSGKCVICNHEETFEVHEEDFRAWRDGVLIQRAMPYLTAGQRELLISETCESCFDSLLGDEE